MKAFFSLALLFLLPGVGSAATIATFEGPTDTPYNLQQFGDGPGPTVETADGNPGGFLQITPNINGQHNFVPFDRSDAGTFPLSVFSFDFRLDNLNAGGADGFSFSYLDTSIHGVTGPISNVLFTAEDPAAFAVLGFGFDTWGNAAPIDDVGDGGAEFGPNYSEITLFQDGNQIARIDDTRLLATPLDLKDGAWHRAAGTVDFQNRRVSLSVDGNPIFTNLSVPDLAPFESRVMFAARTGGANERAALDNINVQYGIPEPGTAALLALGGLWVLRRRSLNG